MLRSRGRHHPLRFASVVAVLTLGAFATPTSAAPMGSSSDGTLVAVVSAADQSRPEPKKRPPSPSPTPSPTPDPTPTPEPTPTPTPRSDTDTDARTLADVGALPQPHTRSPARDPRSSGDGTDGLFGPTSPGASVTGGDTRSDLGIGPDRERAEGGRRFLDPVRGIDPHPTRLDRRCARRRPRVLLLVPGPTADPPRWDRPLGPGHRSDLDRPRGRRSVRDPHAAFWARAFLKRCGWRRAALRVAAERCSTRDGTRLPHPQRSSRRRVPLSALARLPSR